MRTPYDPFRGYDAWKTASPYDDDHSDLQIQQEALELVFQDYAGPADLYRSVYKYTDCGPSIGFEFQYEIDDDPDHLPRQKTETVYCDDIRARFGGTWKDLREQGVIISGISVSSIVEGVDQTTETHWVEEWEDEKDLSKQFWNAVEAVNNEANEIWNETHGCEKCAEHFGVDLDADMSPVWKDCPECSGYGEVI